MMVLVTTSTAADTWTWSLELARGLAPSGVEVALAVPGEPLDPARRRDARGLANVRIFEAPEDRGDEWLAELAAKVRPDVVHVSDPAHATVDLEAPVVVSMQSCALSWLLAVKKRPMPGPGWDRHRAEVARALARADALVLPSHAMLGRVRALYGAFPDARVVENGRSVRPFLREATKSELVLAVGDSDDEAANVSSVLAVAPRLEWPVHVLGTDSSARKARNATFSRPVVSEERTAWMRRASIFVRPARHDPAGFAILDAALSSCALVLGDVPELREAWDGAALFVHPDEPRAVEVAVRELVRDRALREDLARRARSRGARFSGERMARGHRALYDELSTAAVRRARRIKRAS